MQPTHPRLQQLLKTARQPQWIAAFLSVGFHVVLFAAGPSVSGLSVAALGGSDPEGEARQVPLLELSPEEQSRLPDFSSPVFSPFPEGNDDLFSLFPPSGDSLPFDSDSFGSGSLGSGLGSSPSLSTPRLPSSPFTTGISPYRGSPGSSIVIPRRSSPNLPMPSSGPSSRATPPRAEPPAAEPETPAATAPDRPAGSAADLLPDPRNESDNGVSGEAVPLARTPAPERASELRSRAEYSAAQTGADEVAIAKAAWRQSIRAKLGADVAEVEEPIVLPVTTPGRVCLSPEPTDGLLGLVGVPNEAGDGLELFTAVLRSTGYPLLNQRAEQALRGLEQVAGGEAGGLEPNTLYQVVIEVEYDSQSCIRSEALLRSRTSDNDGAEAPPE
ncbi:MAG: hypothetical protein EA368_13865 [Leptolyngbya sp. DLM2.Bin27]|nr:MAG: hypothetical protein EA368_13865 [Leptolyngbya sp. DLM2.Bin27]